MDGRRVNLSGVGVVDAPAAGTKMFRSSAEVSDCVLIVDDSRVTRKMSSTYLSQKFDCVEADSFDAALAFLKQKEFSVVVTDIIMPGLSGIELLRKIISDFPNTEVIVASSVDRPQRALDAIRLGAFDYLIKPCDPHVWSVTVERAVERRNLLLNARNYNRELEKRNSELTLRKEQLEKLQAQIVQKEKMASLGQLTAGIAHEINNPVGFVHSNLEMLEHLASDLIRLMKIYDKVYISFESRAEIDAVKSCIGYPAILDDLTAIVKDCRDGSNRIREIVENLRTFSRLDESEYRETDIHEGIDATIRLLNRYFGSDAIALRRNYADLPKVRAFAGPLNQVWMNLLVNAAQSIGDGSGTVSITTRDEEESIYVEIADTGVGIPVQDHRRIFDPFFTTKPVGEGTGLGLAVSFGIVQSHGGSISVKSRLNEGSTFTVCLPKKHEELESEFEKSINFYKE